MNTELKPCKNYLRWQVAEMLNVSVATIHLFTVRGKKISNDQFVKLHKTQRGFYQIEDIESFLEKIKK